MKQMPYYSQDVDFDDLAKRDPDFATISQQGKRNGFINFQDPKIVQQLTKSLLKCDFGLTIDLPDDRLCPPVPVRWNYVRWIQDLLDTTSETYSDVPDPEREVLGMDIGVGASCIYSLLACGTRRGWRMVGTDVDERSLFHAHGNVERNQLQDRIHLSRVQEEDDLLPLDDLGVKKLDFVMTNPPFYTNYADFEASYNKGPSSPSSHSDTPLSAVTVGSRNEMITPGGDVGFITRLLRSSLTHTTKITWYTAMLSKLSSLHQIISLLKRHDIDNFAVTSLHPGKRTKRYAVAWSVGDLRPRNDVCRHGELVNGVLPSNTAWTVPVFGRGRREIGERLREVVGVLEGWWVWSEVREEGVLECGGNVWSRAARRKKRFEKEEDVGEEAEKPVALAVKVMAKDGEVEVRWLRGHNYGLFEGFCGMLKRAMNGQGGG